MQRLVVRLEALGDRLQSLELSQETDQRNQQVRLTHADRKMEEAITVAQNSLTQVRMMVRIYFQSSNSHLPSSRFSSAPPDLKIRSGTLSWL